MFPCIILQYHTHTHTQRFGAALNKANRPTQHGEAEWTGVREEDPSNPASVTV